LIIIKNESTIKNWVERKKERKKKKKKKKKRGKVADILAFC
jgi:hypothetical protein